MVPIFKYTIDTNSLDYFKNKSPNKIKTKSVQYFLLIPYDFITTLLLQSNSNTTSPYTPLLPLRCAQENLKKRNSVCNCKASPPGKAPLPLATNVPLSIIIKFDTAPCLFFSFHWIYRKISGIFNPTKLYTNLC